MKFFEFGCFFTKIVKDDGASGASGAGKGTGGGMAALKAKQRLASKGCLLSLSWKIIVLRRWRRIWPTT